MNNLSVTKSYQHRRRFSREFKAEIVVRCLEPGASVSRIALDNGLNANLVRRWISEARRASTDPVTSPAFLPVKLPTGRGTAASDQCRTIRIEISRTSGLVVIEWPAEQAQQCIVLLRELLQ